MAKKKPATADPARSENRTFRVSNPRFNADLTTVVQRLNATGDTDALRRLVHAAARAPRELLVQLLAHSIGE